MHFQLGKKSELLGKGRKIPRVHLGDMDVERFKLAEPCPYTDGQSFIQSIETRRTNEFLKFSLSEEQQR